MTPQPPTPTGVLRELAEVRRSLEALEYEAIQLVRAAGATWEAIGDELGISRQAARSRFAKPRPRRTRPNHFDEN